MGKLFDSKSRNELVEILSKLRLSDLQVSNDDWYENELSNFVHVEYDNQNRIDLLKMLYQQMHTIHKADESFENKVTVYFCTFLLAITGYLFRFPIDNTESIKIIILLIFIGLSTATAVMMLVKTSQRIRLDSRLIVRIETALGLYSKTSLAIPSTIQEKEVFTKTDYSTTSLFPHDLKDWGVSDKYLSLIIHIAAVVLCSFFSMFGVLSSVL